MKAKKKKEKEKEKENVRRFPLNPNAHLGIVQYLGP